MNANQSVANFISTFTEPMNVILAVALLGGWQGGLRGSALGGYAALLGSTAVAVYLVRLRFMKSYRTNWDVSERVKRIPLLIGLLVTAGAINLLLGQWHTPAVSALFEIFFVWLTGFFLITLKTKISGHVGVFTLAAGLVASWFGSWGWLLLLFVPLVAWSRLHLHRHTVPEVIGGFLYSLFILLISAFM